MKYHEAIISQYLSALDMLEQTITQCPDTIWNNSGDKNKFWHVAYHALFYTHLYLQDSEQTFTAWNKHRDEYQFLGHVPWPPRAEPKIGELYDRETVLEYLAFCREQVVERVTPLDLDAVSGFHWLPFSKLELQIYSIRHLQQHTGELMERLGTRAGVEIDWIGRHQVL